MKNRLRIKFENTLRRCYFYKDRQYRSDSERAFAESALRKLWQLSEVTVKGVRYKRNEIRRQMLNEMMPETVDNALQYSREMNLPMTAEALAEKIFEYTVTSNEAVALLMAVKRLEKLKSISTKEDDCVALLSKVKVREVLSRAE